MQALIKYLLFTTVVAIMNACGGGSGGGTQIAGIDGTGGPSNARTLAIGTVISRTTNTMNVNGVEYNTTEGDILINGNNATSIDSIVVGDIVTIDGEVTTEDATGIAISVNKETNIIGPISAIDAESGTITVLQQLVVVPETFAIATFAIGDVVEVIGFPLADNSLNATRVDTSSENTYVFTGQIRDLDASNNRFFINNQAIDTGSIDISTLNNGDIVAISGVSVSSDNTLTANALRVIESPFINDIDTVEVEGFVTTLSSEFDFSVNGVAVIANRQTEFVGNTADQLALNTRVEVEGTLDADGNIEAQRILFLVSDLIGLSRFDRLSGTTETFSWTDVDADEYRLRIQGLDKFTLHEEYYDGATTSATVSGLPANRASVDITISTRHEQWWTHRTVRVNGVGTFESARLISHEDLDNLSSTTETFAWNDVSADEYRLQIINSRNGIYDQRFDGNTLQTVVSDLPRNNAFLEIILSARHGNWWSFISYRKRSVNELINAEFTSHSHKDTLTSSTETFTWTDVGADGYRINIQSLSGFGREFYNQEFDSNTTSVTIEGLPLNNARMAVRLHTNYGGFWSQLDHEMFGAGTVADAELTSHVNLESINSAETVFSWSEIPNAEQYIVSARTVVEPTRNLREIYREDFDNFVTSTTLRDLPRNGALFDLTIRTQQDGWWGIHTYRLKGTQELDDAELLSHSSRDDLNGNSARIEWTDVGADEYIITAVGNGQVYDEQFISAGTTATMLQNLPADGSLIDVSIKTGHGGWWVEKRYSLYSQE